MAVIESWFDQDLTKAVKVQYLDGNVFSADNQGNKVGVRVFQNGEAASLSGTISANIIRADGATVTQSGSFSGNEASVILPESAYAVPGVISIIIKNTVSSVITTLCAVVATVYESTTSTIVDPGTIIPSVQALIDQIDTAVSSIPADYSSLWTKLAPAFSTSTAYVAGQYVTYNGGLYRFITAHAAGSWNSSHVVAVNLGGEITDLKSALFHIIEDGTYRFNPAKFYNRGLNSVGEFNAKTNRVSSLEVEYAERDLIIYPQSGYRFYVCNFNSGGTYVNSSQWNDTRYVIAKGSYYKISIALVTETEETADIATFVDKLIISPSDNERIEIDENGIKTIYPSLAIGEGICSFRWEFGTISGSGYNSENNKWVRTVDYIPTDNKVILLSALSTYRVYVDYFNSESPAGFVKYVQLPTAGGSIFLDTEYKFFRICMKKADESTLTISEAVTANPVKIYTSGSVEIMKLTEHDGWFNASGVVQDQTEDEEKYTEYIPIGNAERIRWEINYQTDHTGELWVVYMIEFKDGTLTRYAPANVGSNQKPLYTIDIPANAEYIAFSYRTYGETYTNKVYSIRNIAKPGLTQAEISKDISRNTFRSSNAFNPYRFCPFHDHLFIENNYLGLDGIIPSESLHHVRISRRLGFNVMEGNCHKTYDNHYVIIHGSSGKFGGEVVHIDGETDISNVAISSKTLEWIQENVIYNSSIAKYRTTIPTIEEWLIECRESGIVPLLQMVDKGTYDIANQIMGKDNYIAYHGDRKLTSAPIVEYLSLETKDAILEHCRMMGVPYLYTMANPSSFTDSELTEIVDAVHQEGFMIGIAGCYLTETDWQRVRNLGFDFSASGWRTPEIVMGDIADLTSEQDFSAFDIEGGTVSGGVLSLDEGGTVGWSSDVGVFLSSYSLHIVFDGTIKVKMGNYINNLTLTSDGTKDIWLSTYRLNTFPNFIITATASTDITSITFKAKKC